MLCKRTRSIKICDHYYYYYYHYYYYYYYYYYYHNYHYFMNYVMHAIEDTEARFITGFSS